MPIVLFSFRAMYLGQSATTSFNNFVQKLYYLFMIIIDLWMYLPVHVLLESFNCKK